jgi:hypothetical protein
MPDQEFSPDQQVRQSWPVKRAVQVLSGFLSQNPMTLHFGLGTSNRVDKVIITWPSGKIQEQSDFPVNQTHQIREQTTN